MAPGIRESKGGLGASLPAHFFDHVLFALRQRSIIAQRFATYTGKSCKNEKAKMKESKQNDRNRVQDDNITESANARLPLLFRNFL